MPPGATSPVTVMGIVDDDLLAAPDDHEVDVLENVADRVALDVPGQRQLSRAVEVDREQDVGRLEREHQLVAGQGDVPRCRAVAVEDGGDLVGTAGATGGALAELGALLGCDADLGHGVLLVRRRAAATAAGGVVLRCSRARCSRAMVLSPLAVVLSGLRGTPDGRTAGGAPPGQDAQRPAGTAWPTHRWLDAGLGSGRFPPRR
jgi:hypothetical protein